MNETAAYKKFKKLHIAKCRKLANKRKLKGYSQVEVASKAGISERSIIDFEHGRSDSAYLVYIYENL